MKQRVISAIVAILIIVPFYLVGGVLFEIGVAAISLWALKEIFDLREKKEPYPLYIKIMASLGLEFIVLGRVESPYILYGIPFLSVSLSALTLLIPTIFDKRYTTRDAFGLIGALAFLGTVFNLLIILFNGNKWLVLYLILIATMTDTFAMVIGSLIGKHKLIPDVSPKKTVEGSIFGTILGVVISSIYYVNIINSENVMLIIVIGVVLSIFGQLGDLLFSKIKREYGIKDFSNIMPGHGGILDRLDSLTFILLGYTVILNLMNLF